MVNSVLRALEVGYRHIDTATVYGNEEQVGQAVAQSGVRREDIFVTTKLPPSRAGHERETLESSLDALALGYVDLWLIHWPPSGGARPDVWERLLELQAEGLTREVGVSNYSVSQIDELSARQVNCQRSTRSSGAHRSSMRTCSRHTGAVVCSSRVTARC